jgi:hypothetical protein
VGIERAREAAGSRLRTRVSKDAELRLVLADVQNRGVAAALGRDRAGQLANGNGSPEALVAGSSDCLRATLLQMGLDAVDASRLSRLVERQAARTLFDEMGSLSEELTDAIRACCGD